MPHSFTYIPDLARAMITASQDPSLWGQVLHAPTSPAVTQRQLATALAEAAGAPKPKLSALPAWVLKVAGLVSVDSRELAETSYMFTRPFVLDSSRSESSARPVPDAAGRRRQGDRRLVAGRARRVTCRPLTSAWLNRTSPLGNRLAS